MKDKDKAEEIVLRINHSYLVFNKNAQHGLNNNTVSLAQELIEAALKAARAEQIEIDARIAEKDFIKHDDHSDEEEWYGCEKCMCNTNIEEIATAIRSQEGENG